ncbi:MAG TPA: metal-dependent hydrolase [Candidatus Avamphibacillus intestinigallinarum]|nr:metal-dependent hydrolase [Candidatus Avamphibacillus intestinigallinarum]
MDTGTHVVMGVALGGLATLDPVVASDPALYHTVFAGVLIGSNAPDADTILKFKNNALYIRNHRGITHSLPAVLLWGILISGVLYAFVPSIDFAHLWLWTQIAVALHVLVDIFNAYGTQAYRPFSRRWVAYGFINTFDPYIFLLHIAGIVAWLFGANPGFTFLVIYGVILLYYIKRYLDKREIVRKIKEFLPDTEQVVTSPTMKQNDWRVAITTKQQFFVGVVEDGHIHIIDEYNRVPLPDDERIRIAMTDKNIDAFLSFSPVYRFEIHETNAFSEVRFIDLRYRSKGYYPFVAVVHIDENMHIISSYTGWIFSEHKLQSKLYISDQPI